MEYPSSQINDPSPPLIFFDPPNSPINIFVDPNGIARRPKLVRALKKSGALICSDPKNARVILVDSHTKTGRLFIADWGSDHSKAVLEYVWAKKCIDARKLFNADEGWGGCIAVDDGSPLNDGDIMDEDTNPLPTPRPTPMETGPSRKRESTSKKSAKALPQPEVEDRSHTPSHDGSSNISPIDNSSLQNSSQSSMQAQSNMMSQYNPLQYSQNSMMPQFPFQPQSSMMQQYSQSQLNPANIMQMLPQMLMAQSQFPGQFDAQMNQSFTMSIVEVMKAYGINPWAGFSQGQMMQNPMSQSQSMFNSQSQPQPNHMSLPPYSDSSNTRSSEQPGNSPYRESSIDSPPPSSEMPPPAIHRKSESPPPRKKARTKGKRRASSPGTTSRKETSSASSGTTQSWHTAPTSPRRPHSHPSGKLFTTESGRELAFFVQIDLNNRLGAVTQIKKNGGKITNDHTLADYSVLYSPSKTVFNQLLKSTLASGKPAVNASFIYDCVEHDTLLDPTEYLFSAPAAKERAKPESKAKSTSASPQKRGRKPASAVPKQEYVGELERSPTPPPESARVLRQAGRYAFTEVEHDYMLRYIRVLCKRNPYTTITAMGTKLAGKLPHHSAGAWLSYIRRTGGAAVEEIQKRAGIAWRKEQSLERKRQRSELDDTDGAGPSKRTKFSPSSPVHIPPPPDEHEQSTDDNITPQQEDFNFICEFFASGGGDDGTDAEVWARLTDQKLCQTFPSWPEFYEFHSEDVNAELQRLSALQDTGVAGDQDQVAEPSPAPS